MKMLSGNSKEEIEKKIDDLLAGIETYQALQLIMPVNGASVYDYRGFPVRIWTNGNNTRYDCAYELKEEFSNEV